MTRDDAEEYTQALGQVVAGGWRQVALGRRLGVPQALGLSVEEWVQGRLGGYVRLSIPERREAVKELTTPIENGGSGLSMREAAEVLGIGKSTVERYGGRVPNGTEDRDVSDGRDGSAVPNGTPPDERRPSPGHVEATFLNGMMEINKLTLRIQLAGGIEVFLAGWDRARRARYAASFAALRATLERWEAMCLEGTDGD